MEVILLEKLINLGEFGDIVNVKPGYARNYLVPKGKAITATVKSKRLFELKRIEFEKKQQENYLVAQSKIDKVKEIGDLELKWKSGVEGKLFGSVTVNDIVDELHKRNLDIKRQEIKISEKYIKQIGEYEVVFTPIEGKGAGLSYRLTLKVLGYN